MLWRVRPRPTTHLLWVRGSWAWGPVTNPDRALLLAGFARCGGGKRAPRGGAPLAWVWGVRGRALSQPRPLVLWGVLPGPTTHWLPVRGVWASGPVTNPTARALAHWLCALWGWHEGTRGGRLLPWCGASGVRRSSNPDSPSFGACGRSPLPTGCGCGWSGCRDRSPTPQRELLRAGFVRFEGGMRAPGGAPLACVWAVRVRALSHARPSVLWGVQPGPTTHWLWVAGVRAWKPVTNPAARALASWLCALWRRHEGSRGGPLLPVCGASGVWRSQIPDRSSFGACSRGPLPTGCGCRGVRAWGPVTNPTARPLASWLWALWGRHEGARGGTPLALTWGVRDRALSQPRPPVLWAVGWCPIPTGCGCGGRGLGDPPPTPLRALLRAGFACCGGGTRAPGGGASCLLVGRQGSGTLPPPTACPLGRVARAHHGPADGAGAVGVGTRH